MKKLWLVVFLSANWRCSIVAITNAQISSSKSKPRFCTGSNPPCGMLEVSEDEDIVNHPVWKIGSNASFVDQPFHKITHHPGLPRLLKILKSPKIWKSLLKILKSRKILSISPKTPVSLFFCPKIFSSFFTLVKN